MSAKWRAIQHRHRFTYSAVVFPPHFIQELNQTPGDHPFFAELKHLDAELLQLSEVSPLAVKASPYVAEKLFDQWLSLPETNSLVKSLLSNAKGGGALNASGSSSSTNATANNSLPSMFPAGSAPPLSPRSSSGSPRITKLRVG